MTDYMVHVQGEMDFDGKLPLAVNDMSNVLFRWHGVLQRENPISPKLP